MTMPSLPAQTDNEWRYHLIVFVIIIVLMVGKAVLEWLRQQAQRDAASQPRQDDRREPTRGESVEDVVRTMRQARQPQAGRRPTPQPYQPIPQARQAPQQAAEARQAQQQVARRQAEQQAAQARQAQQRAAEQARQAGQQPRPRRRAAKDTNLGGDVGLLGGELRQQEIAALGGGVRLAAEEGIAPHGARAVVEIGLGDPDEVRRGILYSEILGPPVALRAGRQMWDA